MRLHINDISIGTKLESEQGEFIISDVLFDDKKGLIQLTKVENEPLQELLKE